MPSFEKVRFLEWVIKNAHDKDGKIVLPIEIDNEDIKLELVWDGKKYFAYTKKEHTNE